MFVRRSRSRPAVILWGGLVFLLVSFALISLYRQARPLCACLPPLTITPTHTPFPTSDRGVVAPPATRSSFGVATPNFAANVPTARTNTFDAGQLAIGRKTYTQWCATCHGDRGQGLEAWRSAWLPEHQTCTQAGCHGANHPPDGFSMRKVAPPVMGEGALANYPSAFVLYIYMQGTMPYQAPGVLSKEEYLALSAYLADQHGADGRGATLTEHNADQVIFPKN
ncbi:MAG TPA: hypothetical protein PLD47_06955 [Aggregatilineales bacterium]|nr:hypothetical protein [Anaerolineales bacterium]HRE47447.1 hypothetical protein [Aggregatilineales bacterium]